ncbi:MAG: [FeFe] hydrogenase H-cluster radical SAM maturase HydE [Ruminococcus sp.]|nr:[FeFe] hydrogenase H-cluster radical SAM maturase HydE [Ruminococcus sp.]
MNSLSIIEQLKTTHTATREQLIYLLKHITDAEREVLREAAQQTAQAVFGNKIYIRGLVEISSICKRDCRYCGLRRSNPNAVRYRLTPEQILSCCEKGYALGFRTFVLQGGEDGFFSDEVVCGVVREIKRRYPDCAVTLSLGERGDESFRRLYAAGADRYLLRHETADLAHYAKLHPDSMSGAERQRQLFVLKQIGYQTGAGFMVGSPYQTAENLADDLLFLKKLQPQMCGIGPFIPHKDTEFRDFSQGSLELTLTLLAVIRLMHPRILLPATTALGTIHPQGRELGILHGANVVMPNLSPLEHRKDYAIYDNKICTGDEAAECIRCLSVRVQRIGYKIVTERGDYH